MLSLKRLAPIAVVGLVAAASCDDPTSLPPSSDSSPEEWAPSLSVVSGVPAVCGDPTEVGLMLGPNIRSGSVEVANDESNLYVTFRSDDGRPILATAVFVGDSPSEIPTTSRGLPRLLRFPYKSGHRDRPTEVVWEIPLSDVSGGEAVVAAFAQVGWLASWGEGEPITPGRHWAMYFTHTVADCGPEPVGPEGGTASDADGQATLTVPEGALETPVAITIAPATVSDLADHVPPEEFDPELGTVFGVTPIPGTIWDLQPDGLEFTTPATIVLHYEESALPEGTLEEELGIFIINGIFERLPATVDTDANTITAEIGHFSFAFTAPPPAPRLDLELTSLSASSDPRVGEPIDVTAEVRNNGPGNASGATVLYEALGTVFLGNVDDSCTEVPDPSFGDVAVSCDLPPLLAGEFESTAAFQVIPQEAGETIEVRATAFPAVQVTELNPDNDTQQLGVIVGGEGANIDLKAGAPGLDPDSDPRVGGLMGFVGRVDNLGPGASNGGTMLLEAFGDVVLGDVPSACTEIQAAAPVTAAIECPVEPLEQFDIDLVGPFRLTAQSAGDVQVVATVTPAPEDTDVDPENNVGSATIPVASTFLVDLAPLTTPKVEGTRELGSPLTFAVRVGNFRPPSNGGTIIYEAIGDVVLGAVAEGCTPSPNPSAVAVFCSFDPFPGFVNDTGSFNLRKPVWVGPFEVIPQSDGLVTFAATTVPVSGDTDVNPDNDRIEFSIAIGQRVVDLEVLSLTATGPTEGDLQVGQPIDVVVPIRNLGPDDSRGAVLVFSTPGDVDLVEVDGPCLNEPTDEAAGVGVSTRCELAPLLAGSGRNVRFQIIPQSEGQVLLAGTVRPLFVEDVDLNRDNGFKTLPVQVVSGG